MCNLDYILYTFFYLKKVADDHCSSITKKEVSTIYIKLMSIQPFTTRVDWPEIVNGSIYYRSYLHILCFYFVWQQCIAVYAVPAEIHSPTVEYKIYIYNTGSVGYKSNCTIRLKWLSCYDGWLWPCCPRGVWISTEIALLYKETKVVWWVLSFMVWKLYKMMLLMWWLKKVFWTTSWDIDCKYCLMKVQIFKI